MRCNNQIYPKDKDGRINPLVNTYCTLEKGHTGDCQDFYEINNPKKCNSINSVTGQFCSLSYGHYGAHASGKLSKTW